MEKTKPDCIILDYIIKGGMNGDKILDIIKEKFKDVYVLVLSGQEEISVATKIVQDGAYDYIVKKQNDVF